MPGTVMVISATQEDTGQRLRASDGGFWCRLALRATDLWDWVDARQVDKHIASAIILLGTIQVTQWAMTYATAHTDKSGIEIAAIIAAVLVPYNALQAAALSFYFSARRSS